MANDDLRENTEHVGASTHPTLALKNPDYKINNEVFDNYAPKADTARKIAGNMKVKVDSGQTNNIVVNLSDSPIKTNELVQQLFNYPIPNLKKVIIIDKQGNYKLLKF